MEAGPFISLFLFLLAAFLARRITRIALCLAFGFQRNLARGGFFLFAGNPGRFGRGGFFRKTLRLSLGSLARFLGFGARSGLRLALGLSRLYRGIIGARLGLELV